MAEYRSVPGKGDNLKAEPIVGEPKHGPTLSPHEMRPSNYGDGSTYVHAEDKGVLNAAERRRSETLPGGRFPMPDVSHARNALARLDQAHGLSDADKAKIRARARRIIGHETPATEKKGY